jgi:hypothetical protein
MSERVHFFSLPCVWISRLSDADCVGGKRDDLARADTATFAALRGERVDLV